MGVHIFFIFILGYRGFRESLSGEWGFCGGGFVVGVWLYFILQNDEI